MQRHSTRYIVYLALFISLNVILTRIAGIRISVGGIEGVRLGLGAFPVIFAGIIFGPTAGIIVGAIGDIIGYQINPMGAYMPYFTLTAALTGAIPAGIVRWFKLKVTFWTLLFSIAVSQLITSVILVSYFLNSIFHIPYMAILPGRVISYLITVPTYAYLCNILIKRTELGVLAQLFSVKKEIIKKT